MAWYMDKYSERSQIFKKTTQDQIELITNHIIIIIFWEYILYVHKHVYNMGNG